MCVYTYANVARISFKMSAHYTHQARAGARSRYLLTYLPTRWFWDPQAGGSHIASEHPLWVSGYVSVPPIPAGWADWAYWQYTDKATDCGPSGSAVDCSIFHGSLDDLHKSAGLVVR